MNYKNISRSLLPFTLMSLSLCVIGCDTSHYIHDQGKLRSPPLAVAASKSMRAQAEQENFINALASVEAWPVQALPFPWSGSILYSKTNWETLIRAAKILQHSDSEMLGRALHDFQNAHDSTADDSKLFLMMRVAFDLPESQPLRTIVRFGGWLDASGSDNMQTNAAWPISWNNGEPRLVAGFTLFEGPRYDARLEYQYFLKTFTMRKL